MKLDVEYFNHEVVGLPVTFAVPRAATDSYSSTLRRAPTVTNLVEYVLRRASRMGRSGRVADFGPCMGALTLPLATHGIEVLAVEALPLNVSILLAAVRAGGLKNVRAIHMAVASEPGVAKVSGHSAWGGAVIGDDAGDTPCDTLANILTLFGFSDVDIIKLDVEGAELPALTGSDEFFARRDDTEIMYESNNHTCQNFGYDRQDLTRRFEEMGFRNYMFSDLGLMPFSSTDPQPWPVMDILATRRDEAALRRQGEVIAPMTDDYITRLLLRIADDNSPHTRKHFLTEVNRVSESVKARPDWSRIAAAIAR